MMTTAAIIKVDCLYGFKALRPDWDLRPGAIVEVDPKNMPTIIARHVLRCDYCGHPPGDGRHKCLNCGAPK